MIVAEDKKIKKCPVSLQPDIENLLQDLSPDDFASASRQEKDDFIQDRQSEKIKEKCGGYGCTWCDRIPVFICLCGPASDPIWL